MLDYELQQQKAQTLGHLGSEVEWAHARLRTFDAGVHEEDKEAQRPDLLDEAVERVWAFMLQREISGLRHWDAVVKDYGIPGEVLSRLGQLMLFFEPESLYDQTRKDCEVARFV